MKKIISNETYGEIVYYESPWTGKKGLTVGGTPLEKKDKNTFEREIDGTREIFGIKGSFITGVKLLAGGQTHVLIDAPKWYEIVLPFIIFAFILVWGNIVATFEILPIVGGALGGAISGLLAMVCFLIMRFVKKIYWKLLVFAACFALTVLACYLIALAILS